MEIRPSRREDVDNLLAVYEYARAYMRRTGNPRQWQGGYPSRELLEEDAARGRGYVLTCGGAVHGAFAFDLDPEPTYRVIHGGRWLNDAPYGVIHRLAKDGEGKEVFQAVLAFCRNICYNIGADTHADNRIMQHLLTANGFQRCGTIYLADGSSRFAYQTSLTGKELFNEKNQPGNM